MSQTHKRRLTTEVRYRLGRNQQRVILTADGTDEVAIFNEKYRHLAPVVIDLLNETESSTPPDREGWTDEKVEAIVQFTINLNIYVGVKSKKRIAKDVIAEFLNPSPPTETK
jgi:hypothetical protein